jgi:hypothetical protein
MKKPKRWTEVYPQGTKEGNEEQRFFIALARHPKWDWRSTAAIVKESGLTETRVEEIIQKYLPSGIIVAHPKNEGQWAYWERVPKVIKKDDRSLSKKDQDGRIDGTVSEEEDCVACTPACNCGGNCDDDDEEFDDD